MMEMREGRRCTCVVHTGLETWHRSSSVGYNFHHCRCVECTTQARLAARIFRAGNPGASRTATARYRRDHADYTMAENRRAMATYRDQTSAAPRKGLPYAEYEDMIVLSSEMTILEIGLLLGRTWGSVARRRNKLRAAIAS